MTLDNLFALAPSVAPLVVLLIYMIQQSRRDDSNLSSAWAGIAPELMEGFREDMRLSKQEAEEAKQEAKEARREAREARLEADKARENSIKYQQELMELEREFHEYKLQQSLREKEHG